MRAAAEDHDKNLMGRIAARDADALGELYDRHASRTLGVIIRVLGHRAEAEDVLQQVFWYVWEHATRYDCRLASPAVWLVVVARSRALDHLRRVRRLPATPEVAAPGEMPSTSAAASEGDDDTTGRALAQLPPEQREVIALAFFRGLTHPQIATNLDVPLGTVKTRIRLGMSKLRQIIEQQGLDQGRVTPA